MGTRRPRICPDLGAHRREVGEEGHALDAHPLRLRAGIGWCVVTRGLRERTTLSLPRPASARGLRLGSPPVIRGPHNTGRVPPRAPLSLCSAGERWLHECALLAATTSGDHHQHRHPHRSHHPPDCGHDHRLSSRSLPQPSHRPGCPTRGAGHTVPRPPDAQPRGYRCSRPGRGGLPARQRTPCGQARIMTFGPWPAPGWELNGGNPPSGGPPMRHTLADPDLAYHRLQQRLDRMPTGAPDSPVFQQILRLLFTEQEAELAAKMPTLCSMPTLSRRTVSAGRVEPMVDRMAAKGLVVDLEHHGERRIILAPVVIGFFEYTFMRVREDAPMEAGGTCSTTHIDRRRHVRPVGVRGQHPDRPLAGPRGGAARAAHGRGPGLGASHPTSSPRGTQRRRLAVPLPPRTHRADRAGLWQPTRTCLTFGGAADVMVRSGPGRSRSATTRDSRSSQLAKSAGLAQTADNVKHGVTYMCNCCGCCCAMMQSIRRHGITGSIVSSNWVAHVQPGQVPRLQEVLPRLPGRRHHDGEQPGQRAARELGDRRPAEVPGLPGV